MAFPAASLAQDQPLADSPADSSESPASVFFPILGYTPETSLVAGATWLRFFNLGAPGENPHPSVFSPIAVVTSKKQIILMLGTELFWGSGKNHAQILPEYEKFPDRYFGIGRNTLEADGEDYTPEQLSLALLFERKALGELSAGLTFRLVGNRLLKTEAGGRLASGMVAGTEKTFLAAPGMRVSLDSRDYPLAPQTGGFFQAQASFYRTDLGSDYQYTNLLVDLRRYWSLGDKGTLAAQVFCQAQQGEPPFFSLPRLGGDSGLRGYLSGRYPDKVSMLTRAEWRSREFWKGLGGTLFIGFGDVAPTLGKLSTTARLYTYGFGLRYTINQQEQVKIRLDMGFGNDDSGFYLSLGEAF